MILLSANPVFVEAEENVNALKKVMKNFFSIEQ